MLTDLSAKLAGPCPSNLTLDRLRVGELSATLAGEVEAHLSRCASCAAKERRMQQQAAHYLASSRAKASLSVTLRRSGKSRSWRKRLLAYGTVLAAAAALLLWLPRDQQPTIRQKGGVEFGFFVKRGDQVYRGVDGERVRPGDQLRFTAHPSEPVYVAIFGIDGDNAVSLYYPALEAPPRIEPRREAEALAVAVELDHVLGEERILGLFCREPIPTAQVRRDLESDHGLSRRSDCTHETVRIYKERALP